MKIKKILKRLFWTVILVLAIYSVAPVIGVYLAPDPEPITNAGAVAEIKKSELPGPAPRFTFFVLGDNHSGLFFNDNVFVKVIDHMHNPKVKIKMKPKFILGAGDITNRGSEWDYRVFNRMRARMPYPFIAANGNHDADAGEDHFSRYVGEREFSFTYANSYFIVLDNAGGDVTEEQFQWLEEELNKSAGYAHRFILAHKMPVSSHMLAEFSPEVTDWSHRLMRLFEDHKVDVVFAGHEHMFKDRVLGSVRYITTGGAAVFPEFPPAEGGFIHYTIVRVHGDFIEAEPQHVYPPFWQFITGYIMKYAFDVIYPAVVN